MFEDRIAKSFQSRRGLLRGAFPAAFEFLVELEERKPPVIWMHAGKAAQIYWQDVFLCCITFVGIGEANTGIRLTPEGGKLAEGTTDRSGLLFDKALAELIERHGGTRNRWATLRDNGEVELRHPAPGAFFRDVMGLLQTSGARDRAERLAAELESELAASEPTTRGAAAAAKARARATTEDVTAAATPLDDEQPAATAPERTPEAKSEPAAEQAAQPATEHRISTTVGALTGATDDAASQAEASEDEAPDAAEPTPSPAPKAAAEAPGPAPAPKPAATVPVAARSTGPVRTLRPTDTHRLIGFEHLVDAYVALASHPDPSSPGHATARRRVEALERVFLCRLPRLDEIRGPKSADRAQVIALCWRCLDLATTIESPFLAPPAQGADSMIADLWEDHGEALGTPIEALRKSCRETVKSALCSLFPGIEETVVSEAELDAAL
ncbi:MAG: hypothetical protein H6747_10510 [Deltaproteobacteria bacterium]|nr:hypothetical protein [Deltaproteobacteria bacterium]